MGQLLPKPTSKQIDAYIAVINLIFTMNDDKRADRVAAVGALCQWVAGTLTVDSPVQAGNSDPCLDCISSCFKNGQWDWPCVVQCVVDHCLVQ